MKPRLLVLPIALSALLALPPAAAASSQTWTVDNTGGAAPAAPADGTCDADADSGNGQQCTLPEAVREADVANHNDTIHFNLPANSTIALALNQILDITRPMTIDGCSGAAATAPCVGIDGSAVNSTPITDFASPVTIEGLAMSGGHSEDIFQSGGGTGLTVRNNWFGFKIDGTPVSAGAGLDLRGIGAMIGGTGPGDRNVFGNNAGEIRILGGDNNVIQGNYFGVGPDGTTPAPTVNASTITIDSNGGAENATGNVIGGDTAASENLISNSSFAAPVIRVSDAGETGNTIARNRGTNNAGAFLDLTPPSGFGNDSLTGPNAGIQAPSALASPAGFVDGSGAAPGATIRIYATDAPAGAQPTALLGYLGQTTADGAGNWSFDCGQGCASEPSSGDRITFNQTDTAGNSSEFVPAVSYTHSVPQPPTVGPIEVPAPRARIDKGPPRRTHNRRVKFRFSSDQPDSSFTCRLDRKPFKPCTSPTTVKAKPGKHAFQVEAVNSAGKVGPPATRKFKVLP